MALYKTEFQLEQQTPMLHFQYGNPNNRFLTLRGTDILPKIKKYLLRLLDDKEVFELQPEEIKVLEKLRLEQSQGSENGECQKAKAASPFKLTIVPPENPAELKELGDRFERPYFGDTGEGNGISKMVFNSDPLYLKISTFDPNLSSLLKIAVPYMFAVENFGTRSNKGYGSFRALKLGSSDTDYDLDLLTADAKYYFSIPFKNGNPDFIAMFKSIHLFYTIIKSGYNHKPFYKKSLLWNFFNKSNRRPNYILWEKRAMKQVIQCELTPGSIPSLEEVIASNPSYFRIWMGYARNYTFPVTKRDPVPKKIRMDLDYNDHSTIDLRGTISKAIVPVDPEFARSQSPILFKPIINAANQRIDVYLVPKPEVLFDKENRKSVADFGFRIDGSTVGLTPIRGFNLNDFLDFAVKEINSDNGCKGKIGINKIEVI